MTKPKSPAPATRGSGAPSSSPTPSAIVVSNPLFKWLVAGDCLFVILSALGMAWCAAAEPPTALQQSLFTDLQKALFMTLGAFLGLIGGKSADLVRPATS
jgi:hypothetical protein